MLYNTKVHDTGERTNSQSNCRPKRLAHGNTSCWGDILKSSKCKSPKVENPWFDKQLDLVGGSVARPNFPVNICLVTIFVTT